MSFGSSFDLREQVRQATDLVDLVSRSINLRRQGQIYVGLCPWHDDSRPSLQVNPQRRTWKCWVCNLGGDVFSFVMKREGVDFPEALRILAERAGIALQPGGHKRAEPGSPDDKQTLYRAMAWAEEQFHRCLLDTPEAEPARHYLAERGIIDDSVRRFHLGYSPDRWQWLFDRARTTPFSPAVLEAVGLVSRSQDGRRTYDRFRGRLIFSIRDTEHRPIAFGARILPGAVTAAGGKSDGPKYLNSPETKLFSKSNNLYALDLVRDALAAQPKIVVVEGYTDVIMAHQCGICNVVAALGTALGERHVRLLQRFADHITLVLDGDDAGQRRTNEILELFIAAQVDLHILTPPGGLDPCDFLRQYGAGPFRALLDQSVDALEHKVRTAIGDVDVVEQPDRAHRALEEILRTMAGAPRLTMNVSQSPRLREQQMLVRLARRFHVEETVIRARLEELRESRQKPGPRTPVTPQSLQPLDPLERELFEIVLTHPDLAPAALEGVGQQQLSTPLARQVWQLYERARDEELGFEFEQVLIVAEDAALKAALVRIYDEACTKAEAALENAEHRLQGLLRNLQFQQERMVHRHTLATLEQRGYDEEEELAVLERIIQNERNRQGISAPTDG